LAALTCNARDDFADHGAAAIFATDESLKRELALADLARDASIQNVLDAFAQFVAEQRPMSAL
jgi:hypothetical protein